MIVQTGGDKSFAEVRAAFWPGAADFRRPGLSPARLSQPVAELNCRIVKERPLYTNTLAARTALSQFQDAAGAIRSQTMCPQAFARRELFAPSSIPLLQYSSPPVK
jgi:hypothetical protein